MLEARGQVINWLAGEAGYPGGVRLHDMPVADIILAVSIRG